MSSKCPVCNRDMNYQNWRDEVSLVEEIEECRCGKYKYHWSYGFVKLKIGTWEAEFNSHPFLDVEAEEIKGKNWEAFWLRVRYYKHRKRK